MLLSPARLERELARRALKLFAWTDEVLMTVCGCMIDAPRAQQWDVRDCEGLAQVHE